jgi:DNA-binding NtrC family response regulator
MMTTAKILVIDDEKNIRLTLQQTLQAADTAVDTAINGEEGLQKVETADYDLVLLDLQLPGIDGLEVLQQLRQRKPHLPVMLLSAHGTVKTAVDALHSGAVDFLEKPFSPREVRDAVARALAGGQARESGAGQSKRDEDE